ncbi:MAG: hypothetical protein QXT46_00550 [Pyrobaculum sp.]
MSCRVLKKALKKGLTASTANWICELAKSLGVDEDKLFKSILRLSKSGVWLEEEDWRQVASLIDLQRHIDAVVDYVLRRVASGVDPSQAVREIPDSVRRANKLLHIREVLSNFF